MATETLDEYFARRDTPSKGSPTGLAMVELLKLCPDMSYEEARAMINEIGAGASHGPKGCAQHAAEMLDKPIKAVA